MTNKQNGSKSKTSGNLSPLEQISRNDRIAVVGVSLDENKYGHKIFRDLLQAGYQVWGINPKGGRVAGEELFTSLEKLPHTPDLVLTVVPPAITVEVARQCIQLGVPAIWMQPGSESDEAIKLAQNHGVQVTSQACLLRSQQIW